METQDIAIEVRNVSKTFASHHDRRTSLKEMFVKGKAKQKYDFNALNDVSLNIRKGTTFGLIGHNGCGKSTLLKIIAGVYLPSSGEVLVEDKVDALLELGAGFHGELTGRENIYLNGAILGRTKEELDAVFDWILDFADIGDFIDQQVKVYSSGMTVRLGFATAVAIEPTILVVDEIIAVGDEEFQRKSFELMRNMKKKGTTIVLVTHSLSVAQEMCDEVAWLDNGVLQEVGPASDVISSYLKSVNHIEASKRGSSNVADEYRENQGSGELRMVGVQILDDDGQETDVFKTGEPATLRIHVRATQRQENVEVGLGFSIGNGVSIAGPNSVTGGRSYTFNVGESFVDYRIDSVLFQPGSIWLTTALVRDGHIFDYSDRQTEIRVRSDWVPTEPGIISLPPGQWSERPEEKVE
ncbi:ABC-2 type transport system ATP-binding protein/lipopolysaccharide transport system ATP-binding protein [Trueperella bonasi]|uniref:ABC-2 type transport system ATP-binding protein/lipopolysaccharide transport system ATP-binding protein n=1 Tax=Trueperella bonasi TaxID=312286 RepID=A0ABT9NF27_9ACTO|nr:ABC transporter ATP-binding protein [Trueperella bonasi]MDP9806001.1 ABC-2 type transport system ATP-binding protein/lipopolysaccharide transport system ATP-binding protein [Trueperella bonasi]